LYFYFFWLRNPYLRQRKRSRVERGEARCSCCWLLAVCCFWFLVSVSYLFTTLPDTATNENQFDEFCLNLVLNSRVLSSDFSGRNIHIMFSWLKNANFLFCPSFPFSGKFDWRKRKEKGTEKKIAVTIKHHLLLLFYLKNLFTNIFSLFSVINSRSILGHDRSWLDWRWHSCADQ